MAGERWAQGPGQLCGRPTRGTAQGLSNASSCLCDHEHLSVPWFPHLYRAVRARCIYTRGGGAWPSAGTWRGCLQPRAITKESPWGHQGGQSSAQPGILREGRGQAAAAPGLGRSRVCVGPWYTPSHDPEQPSFPPPAPVGVLVGLGCRVPLLGVQPESGIQSVLIRVLGLSNGLGPQGRQGPAGGAAARPGRVDLGHLSRLEEPVQPHVLGRLVSRWPGPWWECGRCGWGGSTSSAPAS